jgi:uncharacterized protein YndB with AHSA1/START domain
MTDADTTLTMTRTFAAPARAVFDAWLDPAQLSRWMGPFEAPGQVELDARVGGRYRITMTDPAGKTYTVGGAFREIERPSRLVMTWAWETAHPEGKPDHETLMTLTFAEAAGATTMTLRHERLESAASRDSHSHGWEASFAKLAKVVEGVGRLGAGPLDHDHRRLVRRRRPGLTLGRGDLGGLHCRFIAGEFGVHRAPRLGADDIADSLSSPARHARLRCIGPSKSGGRG